MMFEDKISNSTITFFYYLPTTEERISYSSEQVIRKGNKVENKTSETRVKHGLKIIAGFKDGDFIVKGRPISWDPKSPNYDPAWKTLVRKYASDLVAALAIMVFEVSAMAKTPDLEEEEEAPQKGEAGDTAGDATVGAAEGKDEHPLSQI